MDSSKNIDVICQFRSDGGIIPIKIRMQDENGEFQSYVIRGYIEYPPNGKYSMPGGFISTSSIHVFRCKIVCFGRERILHIYFNTNTLQWSLMTE